MRRFKEFSWTTLDSWSRKRRVIRQGGMDARQGPTHAHHHFAPPGGGPGARRVYEKVYCARGDMENRIKECQADLFADRTSTATIHADQLRLWFASFAYILLCAVRRIGLKPTQLAEADPQPSVRDC